MPDATLRAFVWSPLVPDRDAFVRVVEASLAGPLGQSRRRGVCRTADPG
jgi:hypothetical protein